MNLKYFVLSVIAIGFQIIRTKSDQPQICGFDYFNKTYFDKDNLNDTTINLIRSTCQQYYPQCNTTAVFLYLDYAGVTNEIKVGAESLNQQRYGCWGFFLKVTDKNNQIILTRYYAYNTSYNGYTKESIPFNDIYLNHTFTLKLIELPFGVIKTFTKNVAQNKCQKLAGNVASNYYFKQFKANGCVYLYDEFDMDKVVTNFCDYFGDPENYDFIEKNLQPNLYICQVLDGRCQMHFYPPTVSPPTGPSPTKQTWKLQLTGGLYGALVTFVVCGIFIALYFARKRNTKLKTVEYVGI